MEGVVRPACTITAFRTGDVIPVDGPSGTAKMPKDDLLRVTAENALAGNVAPAFDATKQNGTDGYAYHIGDLVEHDGIVYKFIVNKSMGDWDSNCVARTNVDEIINGENGFNCGGSSAIVLNTTTIIFRKTDFSISGDVTVSCKLWTDTASGKVRMLAYDINGNKYTSTAGTIYPHHDSEENARTLHINCPKGLSIVQVSMSASEIVTAGNVYYSLNVPSIAGLNGYNELIEENRKNIDDINLDIDGLTYRESKSVTPGTTTYICNDSNVNIAKSVRVVIYVWSTDGYEGKVRGTFKDIEGNSYTSMSKSVHAYSTPERRAIIFSFTASNGLSQFSIATSASEITTAGTVNVKVVVESITSNIEQEFVRQANAFFPSSVTIDNLFRFLGLSRKFVWIDDDGVPRGMELVKNICIAKGIKASFAVICHNFDDVVADKTKKEIYKEYAALGYDIVCHSNTHDTGKWAGSGFDEEFVCKDVYDSYVAMTSNNFPTNVFVYPGGGGQYYQAARRAVSRYYGIGVCANHKTPTTPIDNDNPFMFERFFILKTDSDMSDFKSYISACGSVYKIPILGTHSSNGAEFDSDDVAAKIQYLLDNNYTAITANEFYRTIYPAVCLLGMFGRGW